MEQSEQHVESFKIYYICIMCQALMLSLTDQKLYQITILHSLNLQSSEQ